MVSSTSTINNNNNNGNGNSSTPLPILGEVQVHQEVHQEVHQLGVEIHEEEGREGEEIHHGTIQLQSPGGSSHFVQGLVVTSTSANSSVSTSRGLPATTIAHGNTIIMDNEEVVLHTTSSTGGLEEQIICGSEIQMVSLATNENGETILFALPKQREGGQMMVFPTTTGSTSSTISTTSTTPPAVVVVQQGEEEEGGDSRKEEVGAINVTVVEGPPPPGGRPKRKAALKAAEVRKSLIKVKKEQGDTTTTPVLTRNGNSPIKDSKKTPPTAPAPTSSSSTMNSYNPFILVNVGQSPFPEGTNNSKGSEKRGKPTRKSPGGGARLFNDDSAASASEDTEIEIHSSSPEKESSAIEETESTSGSEDEEMQTRRCLVCLRRKPFTEDIFDSGKQLFHHVEVLIAHLKIEVKGTQSNTGLCMDCMDNLQKWHVFHSAISKRHEEARVKGVKVIEDRINFRFYQARVYKNLKRMAIVKEVYESATHRHYARRRLTEKDWDYFCEHLFRSNSVKSEKSRELEKFLMSRKKLAKLFCVTCDKLIPEGKDGYTKHMEAEHQQTPVLYPCDICGKNYPERDMTASTEDYYPHWISHFYFNSCSDCGKRFPTKRALGQHRHAVHKNRQVKCDKCGKVLANKMSLDLHQLRHLPENEKKKYMMKCKVCKKKIAQWNMKCHLATHNEERPWKCDHCDATFKMKGALVSHRDVVHFNVRNHVCLICGEAFKSGSSLRGHVRRHEGRKDFKCEVCHKEYYTYSALKGHKVVHQTVRNHVCDTCGKAFKKKKALDEHATIHTGVKRFKCQICGREVRVKSNLYKHMKIHRKSQPNLQNPPPLPPNNNSSSSNSHHIDLSQHLAKGQVQQGSIPIPISIPTTSLTTSSSHNDHVTATILPSPTTTTTWPSNGTMMVTMGNGSVSEVTPLVVSFVTSDGTTGPLFEINSEQHKQLINAVTVSSSSNHHHQRNNEGPGPPPNPTTTTTTILSSAFHQE